MSYIDLHPGSPDLAGIRHERLTEELTLDNWKEKLIVRRIDGKPALVYVQMLTDDRSEPKRRKFEIWTWGAAVGAPPSNARSSRATTLPGLLPTPTASASRWTAPSGRRRSQHPGSSSFPRGG